MGERSRRRWVYAYGCKRGRWQSTYGWQHISGDAVAEDRHVRESSAPLVVVSFEWPRYQEAGLGRVAS
jgi:hypothetical protein